MKVEAQFAKHVNTKKGGESEGRSQGPRAWIVEAWMRREILNLDAQCSKIDREVVDIGGNRQNPQHVCLAWNSLHDSTDEHNTT